MKPIRALVTGAGSSVGQGIVKALRLSDLPITIICCDIAPLNAGLYRADEALLFPRVEKLNSPAEVIDVLKANDIQVVMVGSEFDLEFFASNREQIELESGARVIAAPLETVRIADDKWKTAEFLRTNGLPYAEAFLPDHADDAVTIAKDWGYPVMLKARRGTSSRHIHVVENDTDLRTSFPNVPDPMLQKLIGRPTDYLNNEYTCSLFKTQDGRTLGPFTARRTIRHGGSWQVEVMPFEELHPVLMAIGERLPCMGSLNIQLMVSAEGPVPFEINARFSGTTAVRAHFGFNEPEMAVRHFVMGEDLKEPVIRHGVALHYIEEIFLDGVTQKDLDSSFPRGEIHRWF